MASNTFGTIFRITTWGESHGKAIGVVIDGCPAGLEVNEALINHVLKKRAPGQTPYTSPRKESDQAEILSGTYEGKTTGTPISILIPNRDADSDAYEPLKHVLRPGHANFTYLEKYGIFDFRGGGRASARETACRVAAGAIAQEFLKSHNIKTLALLKQVGSIEASTPFPFDQTLGLIESSPIYCPDLAAGESMMKMIQQAAENGDSVGGIVEFWALNLPTGLGDPIYEKLDAKLANAMMSLPATKGFEIGSGFHAASMMGSEHNDAFIENEGRVETQSNHAGGVLAGISTGMPVIGRVAFKPPSTIRKAQKTLTRTGEQAAWQLPAGSRHDPCVAIRAVPVVEAMLNLVIADALLMDRCSQASYSPVL
jgi:chorismate synthase